MAIDTRLKRSSVQAYTFGLLRPPADGTIGAPDRAMTAWLYAGFTFSPPVASDVMLYDNGLGFTFRVSV